jgi:hypothetical protein
VCKWYGEGETQEGIAGVEPETEGSRIRYLGRSWSYSPLHRLDRWGMCVWKPLEWEDSALDANGSTHYMHNSP